MKQKQLVPHGPKTVQSVEYESTMPPVQSFFITSKFLIFYFLNDKSEILN